MDNLNETRLQPNSDRLDGKLKRKKLIYYVVIGLLLIVVGIWTYYDFSAWEESGGTKRINRTLYTIYKATGKSGALIFLVCAGITYIAFGVFKYFKKST